MTTATGTAVITGANKGIGYETARQLLERGWTVWLGSRDHDRGTEAVATLTAAGHPGEVRLLDVDVTDDASVDAAVGTVRDTGLDVLINNSGISGEAPPIAEATGDDVNDVFAVNVTGLVRVTHAFLPLLRRSASPLVINLSSGLGSFAHMTDPAHPSYAYPDLAYPASKAAVNMLTVQYAKHVPDVRFLAVAPGFTATDLNNFTGPQSVEQAGAKVVAAVLDGELPSPSYVSGGEVSRW